MDLSGARVVVTGASRGIGAGLAKLATTLGGDALPADLADPRAIEPLIRVVEAQGPIDVLVNNAGVDLTGSLTELPPKRILELIAINLVAPMLLSRAVIPAMPPGTRPHHERLVARRHQRAPRPAPYSASRPGSATSPPRCGRVQGHRHHHHTRRDRSGRERHDAPHNDPEVTR